jgi:hypothetical protein
MDSTKSTEKVHGLLKIRGEAPWTPQNPRRRSMDSTKSAEKIHGLQKIRGEDPWTQKNPRRRLMDSTKSTENPHGLHGLHGEREGGEWHVVVIVWSKSLTDNDDVDDDDNNDDDGLPQQQQQQQQQHGVVLLFLWRFPPVWCPAAANPNNNNNDDQKQVDEVCGRGRRQATQTQKTVNHAPAPARTICLTCHRRLLCHSSIRPFVHPFIYCTVLYCTRDGSFGTNITSRNGQKGRKEGKRRIESIKDRNMHASMHASVFVSHDEMNGSSSSIAVQYGYRFRSTCWGIIIIIITSLSSTEQNSTVLLLCLYWPTTYNTASTCIVAACLLVLLLLLLLIYL